MVRAIEVEIDETGGIHPLQSDAKLPPGRALLTWPKGGEHECYVLAETALAENWLGPEEDKAWAHLRLEK
jgi:hypothetical protein